MGSVSKLADTQPRNGGVVIPAQRFSITACTFKDIDDCTAMGRAMHGESAYANIPYSNMGVKEMLVGVINNDVYQALVARDLDGQLIGMSLVYLSPYYFAPSLFAVYDRCIYVTPAWRGSSVFLRLLHCITEWSKSIGATELVIGTTTKVDTERYEDILQRLGLDRVGGLYKLTLR
jgi:GNAT superfamily N-acetyltransferase